MPFFRGSVTRGFNLSVRAKLPWLAGADLFPGFSWFPEDCGKPWGFETTCESNMLMRKHLLYARLVSLGRTIVEARTGIGCVLDWALCSV